MDLFTDRTAIRKCGSECLDRRGLRFLLLFPPLYRANRSARRVHAYSYLSPRIPVFACTEKSRNTREYSEKIEKLINAGREMIALIMVNYYGQRSFFLEVEKQDRVKPSTETVPGTHSFNVSLLSMQGLTSEKERPRRFLRFGKIKKNESLAEIISPFMSEIILEWIAHRID